MSEFSLLMTSRPLLRNTPMGDGHPIIVCPGFAAGDISTSILRNFLKSKDYNVHGWELGRNFGIKTVGTKGEALAERVIDLYRHTHRKVTLIGWSLGGILAREVAKQLPDQVRQVITLGSPIAGKPESSNIDWLYRRLTGHRTGTQELSELEHNLINPPDFVPSTSIYSKTDGIVAWQTCIEPKTPLTDNIEVVASHCGLGFNPIVFYALADRLCLPEGEWVPFDRENPSYRRFFYPSSGHAPLAERKSVLEKARTTDWGDILKPGKFLKLTKPKADFSLAAE